MRHIALNDSYSLTPDLYTLLERLDCESRHHTLQIDRLADTEPHAPFVTVATVSGSPSAIVFVKYIFFVMLNYMFIRCILFLLYVQVYLFCL